MALEFQEFGPPELKALMGGSWIGKALRLWLQNVSGYCCAFTFLLLPFFYGICHGVSECEGIPLSLM